MRIFSLLLFTLTACSTIDYNRTSIDGSQIHITGWSIGTDGALSGLNYTVENGSDDTKNGSHENSQMEVEK